MGGEGEGMVEGWGEVEEEEAGFRFLRPSAERKHEREIELEKNLLDGKDFFFFKRFHIPIVLKWGL